jgi:hypothetical protein
VGERRRRRWWQLGVVAAVCVTVGGAVFARLPLRSVLLAIGVKARVDVARGFLLTKLVHPETGQVVYLLGTTHDRLFDDAAYSIWHVKSALTSLDVDTALVEVLPEDMQGGRVGDGPVEMPFVVGVAREKGLRVAGIDARWDDGWRARQDTMSRRVREGLAGARAAVVVCGYMHLRGFRADLLHDAGFVDAPWTTSDAKGAFGHDVVHVLPAGFRAALRDSIVRARVGRAGIDPFTGTPSTWFVDVRERVLASVAGLDEAAQ